MNDKFRLGYPNHEVEESLDKYLLATLTYTHAPEMEGAISQLVNALKNNTIDIFCSSLQSLFAHIPYHLHIPQERYFHSIFQLLGTLLSFEIQSEVITDKGRIDLVIITQFYVYVFELKFNADASKALEQIEQKKYYERYQLTLKHIVLVGLVFNYEHEKLTLSWQIKNL